MSTQRITPSLLRSNTLFDRADDRSPGPASYDTQRSSMSELSFSMSSRHKELNTSSAVAPNTYKIETAKPFIEKGTPSFSMRSRIGGSIFEDIASRSNSTAGPTEHSSQLSTMSRSGRSIGNRTHVIDKRIVLSPTKYDALPAFHRLGSSESRFSLKSRTEKAFDLSHDEIESPGPCGNRYNLMTLKRTGSKFSRAETRFSTVTETAPPVGTYNIGGKQLGWPNAPQYTLKSRIGTGDKLFE